MPSRIVYQDWIVALAGLTSSGEKRRHEWLTASSDNNYEGDQSLQSNRRRELIEGVVRKALAELTPEEQEFLESYY